MYNVLKCLLVSIFLSMGLATRADDCLVDGIYYELDANKKEACVKPCAYILFAVFHKPRGHGQKDDSTARRPQYAGAKSSSA